jgi:diaminopimelate epimerase
MARFWRAHGLGNDYLVQESGPPMTAALATAICDRHSGVGADGVLEPIDGGPANYGVRIWNPDGSIAEKSGNGLRIYVRWLVEHQAAPVASTVWTGTDIIWYDSSEPHISIEMGTATCQPASVPVASDRPLLDAPLTVASTTLHVCAIGLGNPHCVVFRDELELDRLPWRAWGKELEVHPRFPNRTNVQIARIVGPAQVEIRIWERGAGETSASGSSSCATAAAAVLTGRLKPGLIQVIMPGGVLEVRVRADMSIRLQGPVEVVGTFNVDERWLAARRS